MINKNKSKKYLLKVNFINNSKPIALIVDNFEQIHKFKALLNLEDSYFLFGQIIFNKKEINYITIEEKFF